MEKRLCPICSRLNGPQDTHCWFCNAELPPVSAQESQASDWMEDLKNEDLTFGNALEPGKSGSEVSKTTKDSEGFTPDWLQRIRAKEAEERAEKKANEERYWAEKKNHEGLPDWLQSLNEDAAGNSNEIEDTTPAIEPVENEPLKEPETKPVTSTPLGDDWLESLKSWQPPDEEKPVPENNQPTSDVLSTGFDQEIPGAPVFEEPMPDLEPDVTVPDSNFDFGKIFSLVEEGPIAEVPMVIEPSPEETISEVETPFSAQDSTIPEGLNPLDRIFETTQDSTELQKVEPITEPVDSLLNDAASKEPFLESIDDVLPFTNNVQSNEEENEQTPFTSELPLPDLSTPLDESSKFLQDDASTTTDASKPSSVVSPFDIPISDSGESPFKADENLIEPFKIDDLPEWLADAQSGQKPSTPVKSRSRRPAVDDGTPRPEKGKLPVWLASRRPVEAVDLSASLEEPAQGEEVSEIEKNVASVAAGAAHAAIAGKPVELGEGLKITNRQKTNAALLSVITTSIEITDETSRSPMALGKQSIWRTLLALVFIAIAVLGGTIFKENYLQPELFPEEVVHTFNLVNTIPVDKPILIAGDFEAGFAGEIRLTFQPILEHLMRKDLNFALMAVNPVDSALLEDQITRGLSAVPTYAVANKVVDLGYFPGGGIAIQTMGNSFSYAVQLTADLASTSTHEITRNIHSLADFGAIIVITDKSENARVWIEQIQPGLGDTPLLLITSAQASPLILPYYKSGQVDGLVSGLPGGMIYERILGSAGTAGRNMASIQLTLGFMAILVFAGGFVCLVSPRMSGGKH